MHNDESQGNESQGSESQECGCGACLRAGASFCPACGCPIGEEHPPRQAPPRYDLWNEVRLALKLWVLLAISIGGVGLVATLNESDSPHYDLWGSIGFAALTLIYSFGVRDQLAPLLALGRISKGDVLKAGLVCCAGLAFIHLYMLLLGFLGMEDISYLAPFNDHGWPLWSAFALISIAPAVFEEIAFRGIILTRLQRVGSTREALILQAAMFSILHLSPAIFVSHFILGLGFGWLRIRTNSLLPGMLCHAGYNGAIVALELM